MVVNSDARLDLDEDAREHSPLRSALVAPIVSNGRSVAVLSFYSCEANAFDDAHRQLVVSAGAALARTAPEAVSVLVGQLAGAPRNSTPVSRK